MITPTEAFKVLKVAKALRLIREIGTGDAEAWAHAANRLIPHATLHSLVDAVERLATSPRKRGGDITLGDLVEAAQVTDAERSRRISEHIATRGRFTGDGITDPAKWRVALVAWTDAIGSGASGEEAEQAAYRSVGMAVPRRDRLVQDPGKIRNLIESAKRNIAVNRASTPPDRQTGSDSTKTRKGQGVKHAQKGRHASCDTYSKSKKNGSNGSTQDRKPANSDSTTATTRPTTPSFSNRSTVTATCSSSPTTCRPTRSRTY